MLVTTALKASFLPNPRTPEPLPTRMCIACRKRANSQNMIPLGLHPEGSLLAGRQTVDVPLEGRRAWLCLSSPCVDKASSRAGLLARSFRTAEVDPKTLRSAIRADLQIGWETGLQNAVRQGLLHSGRSLLDLNQSENLIGILFASDADANVGREEKTAITGLKPYLINIESARLGAIIGKGPRAVVGLRSGRVTRRLLVQLQRWDSLG